MEIMIIYDYFDVCGMCIVNQCVDLCFIIEQFDIDNINQFIVCGFVVECKIGFVVEFGFVIFFFIVEGKQQWKCFQCVMDFCQCGYYLGYFFDLGKVVNVLFDNIGVGIDQVVGVIQYFIQGFIDQWYINEGFFFLKGDVFYGYCICYVGIYYFLCCILGGDCGV